MSMFCYQCQETAKNSGCTLKGVCGKDAASSNAQDALIYTIKGISNYAVLLNDLSSEERPAEWREAAEFVLEGLFTTITNVSFDEESVLDLTEQGLKIRDRLAVAVKEGAAKGQGIKVPEDMPPSAVWAPGSRDEIRNAAADPANLGVLATENEDIRSLKELVVYGCKGIAAYAHHAMVLGEWDDAIAAFLFKAFDGVSRNPGQDELIGLVLETGETAVTTMALLDRANTESYGNPEITEVDLGVRDNPGVLISGHDLKDLEELLEQTQGTGIDVYTHGEMLPAQYYPAFKKYENFAGNYGNSWWKQNKEFESFNGAILMTTNCITPVKESYRDRLFTTGVARYPEIPHISDREKGKAKDFSSVIERAKSCSPPQELETGTITGGFAHAQVTALADKVVEAVKSGAIKKFVVMAGCDGRYPIRQYFTDVAEKLPEDTVILTAGCAKYRYNKLNLGDIGGIPRVLDAGQCNDSYSLAVIALKLKEVFGLEDINDLPIEYDIAWYEQKAVAVLLALLSLGVKHIRLGPTLPAFVSENVAKVLVENFDIKPTSTAEADVDAMIG